MVDFNLFVVVATSGVVSVSFYAIVQRFFDFGTVSRRELKKHVRVSGESIEDVSDRLESVESAFLKFRAKYTTRLGRMAKDEQTLELGGKLAVALPGIVEGLPISDEQKESLLNLVKNVPPDLIMGILRKQKLL